MKVKRFIGEGTGMRAAVLYERNAPLVVEEVELAPPGPGEVQVKLAASGVCHSDVHHWRQELGTPLPAVLGHEGAGIVEAVGPGVTRVQPGDHVIIAFGSKCGECFYCLRGMPHLCTPPGGVPVSQRLRRGETRITQAFGVGSYAERTVVPVNNVVPIPEDVPLASAALIACGVATGVGAVINTAKVEPGANVVVIGTGGVGLNVVQGARLAGAARIIAVDILDNKLALAEQFGATHLINSRREDPVERVRALTGGLGADYAFEVIGLPQTILQAYESVRKGGVAVIVGVASMEARIELSPLMMMRTGRTLMGCAYGSTRPQVDFPRLIALYQAGRLKLDELISQRFSLEEINEAFHALEAGQVARGVIVYS